jgi:hypothetical protein
VVALEKVLNSAEAVTAVELSLLDLPDKNKRLIHAHCLSVNRESRKTKLNVRSSEE